MRKTNKGKRKKVKAVRKPFPTTVAVMQFLLAALLAVMLIWLNILPDLYLIIALAVIVIISALVGHMLLSRRVGVRSRTAGLILAFIFIFICAVGSVYIYSTQDLFSRITTIGKSTEEYYVVVRADDGKRLKVNDLEGEDIRVPSADSSSIEQAREKLLEKVNVDFNETENAMELDDMLQKRKCEAIMVSSSYYQMLEEDNKNFADDSKVIYRMTVEQNVDDFSKSSGKVTRHPFSVYVSGIDVFGDITETSRSDVNMVVTVDPVKKRVLMTSIPRDAYVTLHTYQSSDKLTHAGVYGIEESVRTVEDLLGADINYYLKVNFSTVIDLVDAIGGIEVYSDYSFVTHGRQNRGFKFKKGINELNGREALAFARERYSFEDGDFQRNKNQQKVLKAMLAKILSSKTLLTKYTSILDALKDEMQVNMSTSDIRALVKMQIRDMDSWDIVSNSISGGTGMGFCYSLGTNASVVYPDANQLERSRKRIDTVLSGGEMADGTWTWEYD